MRCPHCKKLINKKADKRAYCLHCKTEKVRGILGRSICPNFCPIYMNSCYYDAKGKFCCIKKLEGEVLAGFIRAKRIHDKQNIKKARV